MKVIRAISVYFRIKMAKNVDRGNTSHSGSKFMRKGVEGYEPVVTKNEFKKFFII
jgi:hypothetical protein